MVLNNQLEGSSLGKTMPLFCVLQLSIGPGSFPSSMLACPLVSSLFNTCLGSIVSFSPLIKSTSLCKGLRPLQKTYNQSKYGEPESMRCLLPNDTSTTQFLTRAQETLRKRGQEYCESQRNRKFVVRPCLLKKSMRLHS